MNNPALPFASGEDVSADIGDSVLALRVRDVAYGIIVNNRYDRRVLKGIPKNILDLEMRESQLAGIACRIDEELRFPLGNFLRSKLGISRKKLKSASAIKRFRRKNLPKDCRMVWDRMMFLFNLSAAILHM